MAIAAPILAAAVDFRGFSDLHELQLPITSVATAAEMQVAKTTPSGASGLREDLGIHHDDVGHGDERSESAEHSLFHGSVVFGELSSGRSTSFLSRRSCWVSLARPETPRGLARASSGS